MRLNFKEWKKTGEAPDHTVFENKDGHQLKVAHKGLHPATRGQLAALPMTATKKQAAPETKAPSPKMADGGEVYDPQTHAGMAVNPDLGRKTLEATLGGGVPAPAFADPTLQEPTLSEPTFDPVAGAILAGPAIARGAMGAAAPLLADEAGVLRLGGQSPAAIEAGQKALMEGTGPEMRDLAMQTQKMARAADFEARNKAQLAATKAAPRGKKMANGGGVVAETPMESAPQQPPTMLDKIKEAMLPGLPEYDEKHAAEKEAQAAQLGNPLAVAEPAAPAPQPQMMAQAPPQQAPQTPAAASSDPYGTNAYQDSYMKGLNSEKAGLQQEAAAADAQGQAQAALLGKQQAIQAEQQSEFQRHFQALDSERAALQKDIQDNHIDPNHFVNTMDGASKIATAIGMIASGMGAGMSHQSNLAVDFLHKQIDNDIKAQQVELGKKENLLSANLRQFGNMRDAMDMTRVMQADVLSNQLKMEAAKQAGPMAKANLLKAAGELEMKSAPVLSQIAMRKTLLSGAAKGQIAPESVIRMVVPEHEQASATKELKEAQGMYKARDNLLSAFDQISKINTVGNRVTSPLQTKRRVEAILGGTIPGLSKETAGRYTESDAAALEHLYNTIGSDPQTQAIQRAQLVKLATEKLNFPELKKWGIDLSNSGRYDMSGQPRIPEGKPVRR